MNIVDPFKKFVLLTAIFIPFFVVLSCSNDNNSKGEEEGLKGNCIENGAKITIAGNHSHTLNITIQDITNAVTKNYSLNGTTGHIHTLTITAEDFAVLKANNAVTLATSTNAGHTHAITIDCKE